MTEFMQGEVELDARAAHTIAAAMREVARADGTHPKEEALIDEFEAGLPAGEPVVDLSSLTSRAHKEAFLKSLVLVAYADGRVSPEERAVIERYADRLGISAEVLGHTFVDVAARLLSRFAGIQVYRDEIFEIGRAMGLDDRRIAKALSPDSVEEGGGEAG